MLKRVLGVLDNTLRGPDADALPFASWVLNQRGGRFG